MRLKPARLEKLISDLPAYEEHLRQGWSLNVAARKVGWSVEERIELQHRNETAKILGETFRQRKINGVIAR